MIEYPSAFETSALAAGVGLHFPRIGYQNYAFDLLASAITASSETANGPKDAPLRPDTAEYWEVSALPATWEIDLGTERSIDYVGIAGHTFGSSLCTVLAETSNNEFTGSPEVEIWTELGGTAAPTDDQPLLFLDDARTCQKVRLTITGGTDMPTMAVFYTGVALVMEIEPIGGGMQAPSLSRQTTLSRTLSRGGQFLGQGFQRHGIKTRAKFELLTPAWYRSTFDPFAKHARSLPYFYAWWPAQYTDDVIYAWTGEDIVPNYMGVHDYMAVEWEMQATGFE